MPCSDLYSEIAVNIDMFDMYKTIAVLAVCVIPAICIFLWLCRYKDIRPLGMGMLSFFIFSTVAEWFFTIVFLHGIPFTKAFFTATTVRLVIFGCLCAGIFEEFGRYYFFNTGLGEYEGRDTAIGYAIGHFSIEIIIMTVVPILMGQTLIVNQQDVLYCIAERVTACCGHTALSSIIWYGICRNKKAALPAAAFVHAVCDAPLGMYNYGLIGHLNAEVLFAVFVAIICISAAALWRKLPSGMVCRAEWAEGYDSQPK